MALIARISRVLTDTRQMLLEVFRDPRYPQLALVGAQQKLPLIDEGENSLLERSIVWNTPKRRKTVEKRTMKKYGIKEWGTYKLFERNKKIRVDHRTGEFFEFGRLAPEAYKKVMAETLAIQKKMKDAFGFDPKDKEVVVLYKDERDENAVKDGKRVIEMEKERPSFFSANLMQKAIVSNEKSSRTTVKPANLS